jgi:ABC transport system ATP-binding/permease protein
MVAVPHPSHPPRPGRDAGQTIVIGSDASSTGPGFVRIGCGAPDPRHEAREWLGCQAGFDHGEDDFIASCSEGVSGTHASITTLDDGGFLVKNLSRTNPTRVDLSDVSPEGARAEVGQRVVVGQWDFLLGAEWPPRAFRRGTWRLPLRDLVVRARRKVLLDHVSMVVERAELVALLGPSGAGKTTLLYALAGIKAVPGGVAGQELARFWGSLGYVPQDEIVHADLTVGQALRYACRLRLPAGTRRDRIEARIDQVLRKVGLEGKKDTPIGGPDKKTLSGGERRRVSLAVALVTNPQVLILDEPTSGLSWTDASRVVECLCRLAESRNGPGRTIITTIHQPDVYDYERFHQVAILAKDPQSQRGARLAFFGPPTRSYEFFGATAARPPEIFAKIDGPGAQSADAIADNFARSSLGETFVKARLRKELTEDAKRRGDPPPRPSWLAQLLVLLSRLCILRVAGWRGLAMMMLIALALGGLASLGQSDREHPLATFGCDPQKSESCQGCASPPAAVAPGKEPAPVRDPRAGLLSTLMAIFLPLLLVSAGTLVSERTLFRNESMAGVRTFPYVLSRFLELFVIGVAFMTVVLAVAFFGHEFAGRFVDYWLAGIYVVAGALSLGLLISSLVPRPELALWAVNIIAIPELLFTGAMAKLTGATAVVSRFTTTRPALEAMLRLHLTGKALEDCKIDRFLRLWAGYETTSRTLLAELALGILPMTLGCLIATYLVLRYRSWRDRLF